jgi:hypothetical protein
MVTVGLLVRMVAKPGKEAEVASFLEGGLALAEQEPATIAWMAQAPELLAQPPVIEPVDVLAAKLPG